jgi:IS1 family transposase
MLLTVGKLTSILFIMNRLSTSQRSAILRALIEGASVRSTCRITGAAKGTVLKLLTEVGEACADYQNRHLVQLQCKRVQCDEIWSFVGAKERNVPITQRGQGRGDVWTWTALCSESKLIACWHIGGRDADAAAIFMEDLASRLANRVQLTTDGHRAYLSAVEGAFGWNGVDYAQLVKLYGSTVENIREAHRRYSPAIVIGTEPTWVMGEPDSDHVSTSFVESHNLTMRMRNRRMTRLTNGYSKKLENHMAALSLYFMAYNFIHVHSTLTKERKGVHTTPAMAAGVADHVWKVEEIINLLDSN